MFQTVIWLLSLIVFFGTPLTVNAQKGNAYKETQVRISLDSMIKTITKISPLQCLLKCRRSDRCEQAAMQTSGVSTPLCLHLSGDVSGNATCDKGRCNGVQVMLMEEFKPNVTLCKCKMCKSVKLL